MRHSTDANQKTIVNGLRSLGYTVEDMSHMGPKIPGFPDILVTGSNPEKGMQLICKVEIKTAEGKLRETQVKYHTQHKKRHGDNGPCIVARSIDDVLRWFEAIYE